MKKYEALANEIINKIGGKENVNSVTHCITRLRFQLNDESEINDEVVKNIEGVVTVMRSAGQYQVVIGQHVPEVYEEVKGVLGTSSADNSNQNKPTRKLAPKDIIIDYITAIFMPSISILCASGMIKGLDTILTFMNVYSNTSGIHILFNAIGDAIFLFLPVVIGYNTAKKVKIDPYIGMVIGLALCYPALNGTDLLIFGLEMNVTYTSSVLPVILTVFLAAPIEKYLNRIMPDVVKSFLVPMIVLLISVTAGFLLIGPAANYVSEIISNLLLSVYAFSPMLSGLLVGGLWQVMVVFGIHMTLIVLAIVNVTSGTPDPILSLQVFVAFAQAATILAISLKTKDKKLKTIAIPSFISAIFGVTEPSIYGITLPRMKMFLISCIGGAASGAYAGFVGLKYYTMAGLGIFEIPALFSPEGIRQVLIQSLIATLIAVVVSFTLAYIFYKDSDYEIQTESIPTDTDKQVLTESEDLNKNEVILSPISGVVVPLKEIEDAAFSSGLLGDGVGIKPNNGEVVSPVDGEVKLLFPTKHAIGLVSDSGSEILIHIGLDTVKLEGNYFEAHVQQGQRVKKGDPLVTFDLLAIEEAGYSTDTPVIVTNSSEYNTLDKVIPGEIAKNEQLMILNKKGVKSNEIS